MTHEIALIAAMDAGRSIGESGSEKLLWHIPEDLKRFKALTSGKTVIMGRKTFDSLGRPLPNRVNIVVTRQPDWRYDGVIAVDSLSEAFAKGGDSDIMVIGGAQIYEQALPFATKVYLTEIKARFNGSALFPDLPTTQWVETERETGNESGTGGLDYDFVTYRRL